MRIDHKTCQEIKNQLWLHDSKVTNMTIDIEQKRITMSFTQKFFKVPKRFECVFHDAVYLQMTNHSPWLGSQEVNGIDFDKKDEFESRYHPLWENVMKISPENRDESFLDDKLMISIDFFSGDIIRIVCSSLEVEELNLGE